MIRTFSQQTILSRCSFKIPSLLTAGSSLLTVTTNLKWSSCIQQFYRRNHSNRRQQHQTILISTSNNVRNVTHLRNNFAHNPIICNFPKHCYHTSIARLFGLEEFRDPVTREQRAIEPVGRSWGVAELRRKSYDDLHKLWYVLYKERNMLLTEQQLSRRKQLLFPQPERILKVRKSMGAIKHVLGERKREHLLRIKAAKEGEETKEQQQVDNNDDELISKSA